MSFSHNLKSIKTFDYHINQMEQSQCPCKGQIHLDFATFGTSAGESKNWTIHIEPVLLNPSGQQELLNINGNENEDEDDEEYVYEWRPWTYHEQINPWTDNFCLCCEKRLLRLNVYQCSDCFCYLCGNCFIVGRYSCAYDPSDPETEKYCWSCRSFGKEKNIWFYAGRKFRESYLYGFSTLEEWISKYYFDGRSDMITGVWF